ncbi:MAG: TIGR03986 family CRISPR-associated RAMP protein [bacterium]
MTVKSVYNFVPAPEEKEVFKPDWAKQVSQDIPFSDGESGEIELTIKAETPIFIRNGHSRDDAENKTERYLEFSNVVRNGKKQYFIPGSSLKGMIRNVLEIMSASRLHAENDLFGLRDLNNDDYKNNIIRKPLAAGWLKKEGDKYVIYKCNYQRLKIHDIENEFGISLKQISKDKKSDKNRSDGKNSKEKYETLLNKDIANHRFSQIKKLRSGNGSNGHLYKFDDNGSFTGDIVVYGSIDNKKYEYVFESWHAQLSKYHISEELMKKFKEIDSKSEAQLFSFLNNNNPYPHKGIPVFFLPDKNEVKHFGFTRLYKMPNTYRIEDLKPLTSYTDKEQNKDKRPDLAECIFGCLKNDYSKINQKGRVFVGHAFANAENIESNAIETIILSSPKPSFYPYYLEKGKTYLHSDSKLNGFKRYPVQREAYNYSKIKNVNDEFTTVIKTLPEGIEFKGKIRFHNLKKEEIGAILSAITFHKTNNKSYHNIGSAKPYGFGKIKIDECSLNNVHFNTNDYLLAYEQLMSKHFQKHNKDWEYHIADLLLMAQKPHSKLIYPELEMEGTPKKYANEFENIKKQSYHLPAYHKIVNSEPEKVSIEKIQQIQTSDFEFNTESYKKLKYQINVELRMKNMIPDSQKDSLVNAICTVFENHKESKRKLSKKPFDKEYEWHTTITKWLGGSKAKELYSKLNG